MGFATVPVSHGLDSTVWTDAKAGYIDQAISTVGGGATLSNIAVRHSVAQSVTTTITPAANTHHEFNVYREITLPATITDVKISANRTNDIALLGTLHNDNPSLSNGTGAGTAPPINPIYLNDESDMEFTTPGSVGTYVVHRIGKIWTE